MHLVVGLGNPGRRYENTRHNAGFLVVDRLGARWSAPCDKNQLGALTGKGTVAGRPAILAKPQAFMNLSGQPVASLRGYYQVRADEVVVVHDDVDLPFGRIKVKQGGGHGGHNGLKDLLAKLGDNEFIRVRFGVSRPPMGWDTADYVLGRFDDQQVSRLSDAVDLAADAVEAVLRDGVAAAMQSFNQKDRNETSPDAENRPDEPK